MSNYGNDASIYKLMSARYTQILDVFVDSFPFVSEHAAFESMAAGYLVIVRITPESLESSSLTHTLPTFRSSQVPKIYRRRTSNTHGWISLVTYCWLSWKISRVM